MLLRRLVSLPLVFIISVTVLASAPLLLLVSWLASYLPKTSGLFRTACFLLAFAYFELKGWLWFLYIWFRYRDPDEFLAQNYRVQYWWSEALLTTGARCFDVTFSVTGDPATEGPSAILAARHASIGDNVLPMVFFGIPRNEPLRYVLKKELMWLPTLDIGAHRLPTLFIDRSGTDTDGELQRLRALLSTADDDESVFIYPEGTRFTPEKHAKLREKPNLSEQTARWPDLLPPRMGGITALLDENTSKDIVFMCHTGFEGAAKAGNLANGSWVGQHVRIHMWRISYDDIPDDHEAFVTEQWDKMQSTLLELRDSPAN